MKKVLVSILAFMLMLSSGLADNSILAPSETFYVNDCANVLSDETENYIVSINNLLYKSYETQIVFVTVNSTGSIKLESFAYKLFNDWKIGGIRNNGFLLVMAIDDEDYWYEIGSNLDKYLTADNAGDLVDTYLEPFFAIHDYDNGAKELFDALYTKVVETLGNDLNLSIAEDDGISMPEVEEIPMPKVDEIDLSDLSFDELVELQKRVTMAMWETEEWQEVVVPQGEWIVGEDIPAGKWTVKCADMNRNDIMMSTCSLEWGYLRVDGFLDNSIAKGGGNVVVFNPNSIYYPTGRSTEVVAELQEGMRVRVGNAYSPALFTPFVGKPSLGFK